MTASDIADYLRRIREANTPPQITEVLLEMSAHHMEDQAYPRLLSMAALKAQRIERLN